MSSCWPMQFLRTTGQAISEYHREAEVKLAFGLCSLCDRRPFARAGVETGLLMKAPEKNRCNESEAIRRSFSLARFVQEIPLKLALFAYFSSNGAEFLCRRHGPIRPTTFYEN